MFGKRNQLDIKKSTSKVQDSKKDLATRIKHLKIILENVDTSEAKGLFEANFSHVYNILYDSFIQAETNLRQRVHKAHKEELECALWILEQVLCLLPELIHKRWQLHSLGRILNKLLHPGNSIKLRKQAIKFFLMWYQALNENAPGYVDGMYASLVPGFLNPSTLPAQAGSSIFHDTSTQNPVSPGELMPILPPASGEKPPDHSRKMFLDVLLEHMVRTVIKLEWQDKTAHHHRCFSFLLERFKIYYLPKICPNFAYQTSLYKPNLELPMLRKSELENEYVHCRVTLILWVANYMHQMRKIGELSSLTSHSGATSTHEDEPQHESFPSLESGLSLQSSKMTTDEDIAQQIVFEVFCSSRDNVNFIHELYRQAFLLNFNHVLAIRRTIMVYKDLIESKGSEVPPYMLELPDDITRLPDDFIEGGRPGRLRNDSYLGAIQKENLIVRAGMQNMLQLFMTHAANVFLLETNSQIPKMLEEQTDACKRILNIYRYMVMHTRMDSNTWEQLLLVLLQITSLVLGDTQPRKKQHTLGGKLAPAIFQTLIVTWIKANLNVLIGQDLWDRFLHVLVSLTHWEDLIKEWAKTLDTLTRVLARHVYNLDLTDLPLEQKLKRTGRKTICRADNSMSDKSFDSNHHKTLNRQDSSLPDGNILQKRRKSTMSRSSSETNLAEKRKSLERPQTPKQRRSISLDNILPNDLESMDRSRTPSPAPSSGMECNSIKDSPIPLDVLSSDNHSTNTESSGEHRGVICGGCVRGWLPDVAVILWKRMLGALGDVNSIQDTRLHCQVFEYLVKLIDTLIKIKENQGVTQDNMSTPPTPELVPPLTLVLPWCFGSLMLPENYEGGKMNALRLLCTITLNCDNVKYRNYSAHFFHFLHLALTGSSKAVLHTALKYLGPRFLSLQLPGSTLLLLDLINSCNVVLNSSESLESTPRTEAVSIIANLLSLPNDLTSISVLQPECDIHVMACPDIKEHIVSILLRAGRREPKGKARCIALSALGTFVYKELTNSTFHPKVVDAIEVILQALKFNNKIIAQLASNILFLLCDHAALLWSQYPRQGIAVIETLCSALFSHAPLGSTAGESDKSLGTALLLCLGEWCMRLGPQRLLEVPQYNEVRQTCLLLQVFTVLFKIITGRASNENHGGLSQPGVYNDFDPNILSDDLGKSSPMGSPTRNQQCQRAITLCAKTVLSHLVTHLGHFPMAIGAARLSSLVVEHDDVPNLCSDELSSSIFSAPNIQLFMLSQNVIASFIELPALDLPGGGVTAGLSTADKQARVLLRDISGKVSWDASILYKAPSNDSDCKDEERKERKQNERCRWESMSGLQMESMIGNMQHISPQRAMRHRPPNLLPELSNGAPDLDQLDDLLQYLGHSSPECLENLTSKLNDPAQPPLSLDLEQEAIACVISQRNAELDDVCHSQSADPSLGRPISRPDSRTSAVSSYSCEITSLQQAPLGIVDQNAFQQCRLLFSQLGLTGWERRQHLHLLDKTERLLRELRNLDGQRCRETHKVAVVYVASGQEDKNSILSNQGGSAAYEQFLASLAWEVELEGHTGFLGGLQRQGSTGLTAPYFATSFLEVIFHVATRMPGDNPEAVLNKTRHLGNDEVHIVWSEHNRNYRRDIIPTEFCDILIVIYPLGNGLNRVTVNCKPDVPHFGVLFEEAIVESNILAGLVRATAICASRAKRTTLSHYQQYYEERSRSLDTVVMKHKEATTFEEFVSRVYSPVAIPSAVQSRGPSSLTSDLTSSSNQSMLPALLDSHGHLHRSGQKIDSKNRVSDSGRGVWFNHSDVQQNVESTSISPRPLKKLSTSLKHVPKKSSKQDGVDAPPESPQQSMRHK